MDDTTAMSAAIGAAGAVRARTSPNPWVGAVILSPDGALIATGETAVRIQADAAGCGGANQELAAGACLDLDPNAPIVICALDTDGTDGPTSLAGAITDGSTKTRAAEKGYDLYQMLIKHDIATTLMVTGDAVITGPTGTNVNDLVVCVVL